MDRSEWTKHWYRVFIKRFMQWVHGLGGKDYPAIVKGIKVDFSKHLRKLPNEGELLAEEDVSAMISVCNNLRDRALVSTLYESGCRIGEFGNMKIKHFKFDDYGVVLSVRGKIGSRNVRVINSTPFLAA